MTVKVDAAEPALPRAEVILKAFRGSDPASNDWIDAALGLDGAEDTNEDELSAGRL